MYKLIVLTVFLLWPETTKSPIQFKFYDNLTQFVDFLNGFDAQKAYDPGIIPNTYNRTE